MLRLTEEVTMKMKEGVPESRIEAECGFAEWGDSPTVARMQTTLACVKSLRK